MTKKQKLKICNKVILHWWENLFLAYAGELDEDDIGGDKCQFCHCFYCQDCPIFLYSNHNCISGLWHNINCAINDVFPNKQIINLVKDFLKQLEYICDEWIDDNNNT